MRIGVKRNWRLYLHREQENSLIWVYFGEVKIPHAYLQLLGYVARQTYFARDPIQFTGVCIDDGQQVNVTTGTQEEALDHVLSNSFGADGYLHPCVRKQWCRIDIPHGRDYEFLRGLKLYEAKGR